MENYEKQIKGVDPEFQELLKDETLPWNLVEIVNVFIDLRRVTQGSLNYGTLRDYEHFYGTEFTPNQVEFILYMDNQYMELINK